MITVPSAFSLIDCVDMFVSSLEKWEAAKESGTITDLERRRMKQATADLRQAFKEVTLSHRSIDRGEFDLLPLWRIIGADKGECKSCGRPIYWVKSVHGKPTPMNPWGTTHFQTCPEAKRHRKQKAKAKKEDRAT